MALSWLSCAAAVVPDSLTVSLITCYPGPEIYELCGHAAVRVRGENIDSVWNFGLFNFNEPNFVYRFVKGETDYTSAGYPFAWFLPEYIERGSKVVEQDLNFTPTEARNMLALLRKCSNPATSTYRYNYVKDNCATRILGKMDNASSVKIYYPDSVRYGTFRNEMRAYHKNYPWYQFGIDIALGSGLDYPIGSREEMFVPVEMERNVASARMSDGRPLVKATRILNEGTGNAVLPPTPWWQTPLFWGWMVAILSILIVAIDYRRGKSSIPVYCLWFSLLGLAGILVWFLVFVSVHEATSPNALLLWLSPFQFLLAVGALIKRLRIMALIMAYYNTVVLAVMLIVWPFLAQSANPAFFPLMGATLILAVGYAIINRKISYIKNRVSENEPPVGVRSPKAKKSGGATARKPKRKQ